ncbi:unnamed protein product [Adineta ricciae]|uniref:HMG box domain-containing protein n=2 Tax=Adineta ricciae TaxID=249248 RepID=A0A813VZR4_ADIRI|nr:unnamed protein product [Adineta ricciae]
MSDTTNENDEIKVFSASGTIKIEPDNDIEERLSPVVEEPASPTTNNSTTHNNFPGFYPFPFLYPYFMSAAAAAAQTNASNLLTVKSPIDTQTNHLFGTPVPMSPFPCIPFPSGMMSQPYPSNFFNPFAAPSSSSQPTQTHTNVSTGKSTSNKPRIKKPLNAFMIFMKEQRAQLIEDSTLKESSAINKLLGQKWKELSRTEQDRYYALAKEERNRHLQMYPNWSARDNYGMKRKKQTGRVEKQYVQKAKPSISHENDPKKCRARYGLEGINQWCKHCRRKKKCTRFLDDEITSSPSTPQSDTDDILSRQINSIEDDHNDSNEENKHQIHTKSASVPSFFTSSFLY